MTDVTDYQNKCSLCEFTNEDLFIHFKNRKTIKIDLPKKSHRLCVEKLNNMIINFSLKF